MYSLIGISKVYEPSEILFDKDQKVKRNDINIKILISLLFSINKNFFFVIFVNNKKQRKQKHYPLT